MGNIPIILAVNSSLGVNSVAELIALAKAKPGELNHGSAGIGSIQHLSGELFDTWQVSRPPLGKSMPRLGEAKRGKLKMVQVERVAVT
jgi:hypothetical protein